MVGIDETRETRDESPLKPQVVARHVNDLLNDNAIVTTDSGTITTWAARHIKIRRGMKFSCSGNLATMAPGLPYANCGSGRLPRPPGCCIRGRRRVHHADGVSFVTAVKHRLPIKVVIIKNNVLGQIKWEQMVFLGNPEYGVELQPIDFVKIAEACGGAGFHCESPSDIRATIRDAFAHDGPALVEAVVDPFEPPMPAATTAKQGYDSPRAWRAASRTPARSRPRCFETKLPSFFDIARKSHHESRRISVRRQD